MILISDNIWQYTDEFWRRRNSKMHGERDDHFLHIAGNVDMCMLILKLVNKDLM